VVKREIVACFITDVILPVACSSVSRDHHFPEAGCYVTHTFGQSRLSVCSEDKMVTHSYLQHSHRKCDGVARNKPSDFSSRVGRKMRFRTKLPK
jgi:hypothetical protein